MTSLLSIIIFLPLVAAALLELSLAADERRELLVSVQTAKSRLLEL